VFVAPDGSLLLNTYDKAQEEEAKWLAGCLLLPREALMRIRALRLAEDDAAQRYGVSTSMLRYRLQVSGVNVQLARTRSWKRARTARR
jgi:Zn-dependent peptidase ImmA (M78 family)